MGAVVAAVAGLERTLPATPAAAAEDADPDGTSIVRGRVLAVAAQLVGSSEAGAEEVAAAGLLARLLAAASDTTDVLLCLSTLELVGTMVATAAGMAAVVDAGLWAALTAWAGVGAPAAGEEEERGAEAALLAPAALAAAAAVYAAAAKHMPGALPALRDSLLPGLFRVVAAACESGSEAHDSVAAMSALATVLAADRAVLVAALARENATTAREWLECMGSSVPELRVAAMEAVATVLRATSSAASTAAPAATPAAAAAAPTDADYWTPYHTLFDALGGAAGGDTVTLALRNLSKPVQESRLATYSLLAAVAGLRDGGWGLRRLFGTPDAAATLLRRGAEATKAGKEWQYSVIDAAVRNPAAPATLGDVFLAQLRTWHAAGAYAVDMAAPGVTVATR